MDDAFFGNPGNAVRAGVRPADDDSDHDGNHGNPLVAGDESDLDGDVVITKVVCLITLLFFLA